MASGSPTSTDRPDRLAQRLGDALHLLAMPRFGVFWTASLLSSIGTWTQQVAEPRLLLMLHASPFVIGLDAFAAAAPGWFLTLTGGWIADRFDRRRVIAVFQSVQMLCPLTIVVLLVTRAVQPWMIVVLSTIVGITDALSMPSFQSIVPSILPRDQVARGLELNATQYNLSRILGPAIAGSLLSTVGAIACFAVNAASYIPFIGVAVWILPRRARQTSADRLSAAGPHRLRLADIVRANTLRRPILTVLVNAAFVASAVTFLPVLVKSVYGGTAAGFSAVLVVFGIGGLIGAACMLSLSLAISLEWISAAAAIGAAVVLLVIGLNRSFGVLIPLIGCAGAALTISNTAANSVLQTSAEPGALGRTVSLYMLAMGGGGSVGSLLTGITASAFGIQRALIVNAVLALAAHLALQWSRTRDRRRGR